MARTPTHVAANVASWERRHSDQVEVATRQWAASEPTWGVFGIPEGRAGVLPDNVAGLDVVELGCGTGYISAWLAQRGARPVGVDPTPGQLAIARRCQERIGPMFPLVRAAGEQVPLWSGSFDLVISEYGAAIWADPEAWIPEAARLLRPGGELVFLGTSTLLVLCVPDDDGAATDRLLREQFGMDRFVWPDDDEVEFHLSHGDWIRLLRTNGFEIEDLLELRPDEGMTTPYPFVTPEWAGGGRPRRSGAPARRPSRPNRTWVLGNAVVSTRHLGTRAGRPERGRRSQGHASAPPPPVRGVPLSSPGFIRRQW